MEVELRREVEAEFAGQMAAATGWFDRWRMRRRMDAEIERRMSEKAPPDALY
jgi:hypothetical protein